MTEYCFGFGISIIPAIFAISALLPAAIATQVKGLCLSSPPYNKVIFCLIKISCNSGYKCYWRHWFQIWGQIWSLRLFGGHSGLKNSLSMLVSDCWKVFKSFSSYNEFPKQNFFEFPCALDIHIYKQYKSEQLWRRRARPKVLSTFLLY